MPKIPGIPNPSGISVSGNINVGVPRVTAEDFGGGKARDTQNFGREFQRAGGTVMDLSIRRERRKADDIYLASHKKIEDVKTELSRRTGRDAENTLAELDKRTQEIVNEASAGLNSRWARERFEEQFGKQNYMNRKWAENHAYAQGQAADMNTFNGLRDKRLQDVEATPGALDNAMRESEAAIREMYAGQDEEFLTAKIGLENAALAERGVMSLGQSSPGEALKMLANPGVEAALGKIKVGELKGTFGKAMISGATKQAESQMRQIGISLGDQFDNEYEIIDALRGIEDRDLARIAREEAETVRKARLAMGKEKPLTAEEKAQENRLAREQASSILAGENPDSPDDDITDEDTLDVALDESMLDETEVRREKVRKYAVAQMKAKKAAQAQERKAFDQEALRVMAAAGWSPSAIDANWPEDLQDVMLERLEKRQLAKSRYEEQQEKAARKARGLELLELSQDELNQKILNGEWPNMVEDAGAGTQELAKLERRIRGEDDGGLTTLQYAKSKFTEVVGIPTSNKKKYETYIQKVDEALAVEAGRLKLDSPSMIPVDRRNEVINKFLVEGDFRSYEWSGYFSPNKYRFEVADEDLPDWKPYGEPVTPAESLPSFAQRFFSPRDTKRQLLAGGGVLIESQNGTITIVNPDGTLSTPLARISQ